MEAAYLSQSSASACVQIQLHELEASSSVFRASAATVGAAAAAAADAPVALAAARLPLRHLAANANRPVQRIWQLIDGWGAAVGDTTVDTAWLPVCAA